MYRDLWAHKATFFALSIIIAVGLCMYITMYMTVGSLTSAIDKYYEDYHFGDVFSNVTAIPESEAQKFTSLDGIEQVTSRLTRDVRVLFEGNDENVYVRLISYEPDDPDALNLPYIYEGPPISQGGMGVYVSSEFAAANNLKAGSHLPVLIEGKRKELLVLGVGQSPEYIYAVSGSSEIFPNPALFGVAMIPRDLMDQLFAASGLANSLSFRLETNTTFSHIEIPLKERLEKYGLINLVPRKDQISHFMLSAEVDQLYATGRSVPFLLLFISSIILVITLRRRVEAQRGQIGIMLAFGYTKGEIMWHYLSYGLVIGLAGGGLGVILGLLLNDAYVSLYQMYFTIPGFSAVIFPQYIFLALLLAVFCSMGACAVGCREVMRLQPAEAMHPPAPLAGRRVFFEKLSFFWNMLTISGKMAIRNMVRTPFRSFVSIFGVALVFAMMAVVFSFNNMMDLMIVDQFQKIEVYDVKVSFSSYLNDAQIKRELTQYSGVNLVETVLEVPCQLRNKNLIKDTVVMGLSKDARLFNLLDEQGKYIRTWGDGAIISETLAKNLDVSEGGILYFDSPLLKDPKPIVVSKIIPQYLGSTVYLEKEALWELLGKGKIVSEAMLLAPEQTISSFKDDYRLSEKIRAISRADEMFVMVSDYMDTYNIMIYVMGIAVSLIGFVIVYNSAVISFSERSRELASLLVLGLYSNEASEIVSFEQWVLSAFGIIAGIPLAYLFNTALAVSFQNDVYTMPSAVPLSAIILAFLVTCGYLFLAQLRINKKMKTLQIVDVLKERE
jgi:putative ABC transport system permease protein